MTELTGKVAAITGAASGIGLACAQRLTRAGARVVLVDRDEAGLEAACEGLAGAVPLAVDLLDPASVDGMVPRILDATGRLDIFHANAGSYVGGDLVDGDPDAFDRMIDLNVKAVVRTVRQVLPHMIAQGTGDVIVTSSVAGVVPVMWEPVYTASKHAVQAFVHTVRRQVMRQGIRVGAVLPGPVVTALLRDWAPERLAQAKAEGWVIDPEEVAEAVHFMLSRPRNVTIRDLVILPATQDI